MLLSYKHNYLFLRSHKTGGTSVQIGLERDVGPEDIVSDIAEYKSWRDSSKYTTNPQNSKGIKLHSMPGGVRRRIGDELWGKLFKFTCVRNPWEMAVSVYYYYAFGRKYTFKEWIKKSGCANQKFAFWKDTGEEVCNDYIRFERLQEDYERICKIIGILPIKLPFTKDCRSKVRWKKEPYQKIYDPETIEIVATKYKKYIEYFGYKF